jgi:hypothetical protein
VAALAPSKRLRLLRALHAQSHRYPKIRWLTQGLTLAILYAVPLLGLARFDLWDGRHLGMRRHVGPVYGLGAVFIGVLAFYIVTFALNAVMGSAVVSDHGYGIHLDAAKGTCKECDSCDPVCPVGLHPRDLTGPKNAVVGIAIEGFPDEASSESPPASA